MLITVKILFFAKAREITGKSNDICELESPVTFEHLLDIIVEKFHLEDIKTSIALSLNEEFCVKAEAKMNYLQLTTNKIDVAYLSELATSPSCGAVSLFIGTTRDNFEDKTVLNLEYEAYDTMALKSLEKICIEMREQWPEIENVVIYHRLGVVPIKEASILIAISSPHRTDALKATDWCIEAVKKKVPIWKKEIYANSPPKWKENKESVYPPKLKKFKANFEPPVEISTVGTHLVHINASNEEVTRRIDNFMERKRQEINTNNVRDFCASDAESSCARVDSILTKRKDSKGHLKVSRVLNTYHRDQKNYDYLAKYIPRNGIEERVQNLELQLSMNRAVPANIYQRLSRLEDRLLYLETLSPEYINFWDKTNLPGKRTRKRAFNLEEVDYLIANLERQSKEKKISQ